MGPRRSFWWAFQWCPWFFAPTTRLVMRPPQSLQVTKWFSQLSQKLFVVQRWNLHNRFCWFFMIFPSSFFFNKNIFLVPKFIFSKMVQNDSRTSKTPIKMIFTPKLPNNAPCTDDCLYSRRCMCTRTPIPRPQPSQRIERGRTYASAHMKAVDRWLSI